MNILCRLVASMHCTPTPHLILASLLLCLCCLLSRCGLFCTLSLPARFHGTVSVACESDAHIICKSKATHSLSASDSFFGFASGTGASLGAAGLTLVATADVVPLEAPLTLPGSGACTQCAGGVSDEWGFSAEQHMFPILPSP